MEDTSSKKIPFRVSLESLEDLTAIWRDRLLQWTCPFVLPCWLKAWWSVFDPEARPLILMVRQGEVLIGVAPLMVRDKTVRFLGDPEICDYFDCIVPEGKEQAFFTTLFAHLCAQGLKSLDLGPVRPDTRVRKFFSRRQPSSGVQWRMEEEEVFSELDLPATWNEFLAGLDGKQRHELRRKLRRLHETGSIRLRRVESAAQLPGAMAVFLDLFSMNRGDKAAFMTGAMASFFRALSLALAEEGLLRLFFLDLDEQPVASVFCFDHGGTRYLYNNAYNDAYQELSVGLLSKVLSLKAAIEEGLGAFNFLKGAESYKHRLGAKTIPLARYRVTLG